MSRGVSDLHGIKGYRLLVPVYAATSATCLLGLVATVAAALSPSGGAAQAILLGVMAVGIGLMAASFSRALSAELQRLDTGLWMAHDHSLVQKAPRIVIVGAAAAALWIVTVTLLGRGGVVLRLVGALPVVFSYGYLCLHSARGVVYVLERSKSYRRHVENLAVSAQEPELSRIRESLDNYLSATQNNPFPVVRGLGVYSISQRAFYDPAEFPFLKVLEENYSVIREELERLLVDGKDVGFEQYGYGSVGGRGWNTFQFHDGRTRIAENAARCPETTRIVETIPGYFSRHSLFSLLKPGASAAPHRDFANFTLNCHLGLVVPDGDCMIRVGNETRKWKEGGCLVFDTSYEHEVWNRTQSQRVVLQVSFLRPELSPAEKEWVSKAIYS